MKYLISLVSIIIFLCVGVVISTMFQYYMPYVQAMPLNHWYVSLVKYVFDHAIVASMLLSCVTVLIIVPIMARLESDE